MSGACQHRRAPLSSELEAQKPEASWLGSRQARADKRRQTRRGFRFWRSSTEEQREKQA